MTRYLSHEHQLNLDDILAIGAGEEKVELEESTRRMMFERRKQIHDFVTGQENPAYGFNRGFGHNVDLEVKAEQLEKLQENLIVSHAAGMGDAAPIEIVRCTMLLRAHSLAKGNSGVRPELVEMILNLLNYNIIPLVPELGSVGASGDLAPLSHIALALLGRGKVQVGDQTMEAAEALEKAGISSMKLEMKEGLALNNGVQFMTAIGLYCCRQMDIMLKTATVQTAMTAQVMLAPETPFRRDLHELRPHPGSVKVAGWIYELMKDSPLREAHRDYNIDGEIQDPYNIRCAAQILGSCQELIDECEKALLREANSVTDNPVILEAVSENGWKKSDPFYGQYVDIVSGGHFHGMPIAVRIYNLFQAMGIIASLVNRRCDRYVDEHRNKGLGRDLKWPGLSEEDKSISNGMMIPEYTSAGLTNYIWGEMMPNHLFSISTNTGQEDHVSMGTGLAIKLLKTLPRLADLLSIEMAYIAQAAAIRRELPYIPSNVPLYEEIKKKISGIKKELQIEGHPFEFDIQVKEEYPIDPKDRLLNPCCEAVLKEVYGIFPPVKKDRILSDQLKELSEFISSGKIVEMTSTKFG
jgi:histidine ammonia-lyase